MVSCMNLSTVKNAFIEDVSISALVSKSKVMSIYLHVILVGRKPTNALDLLAFYGSCCIQGIWDLSKQPDTGGAVNQGLSPSVTR